MSTSTLKLKTKDLRTLKKDVRAILKVITSDHFYDDWDELSNNNPKKVIGEAMGVFCQELHRREERVSELNSMVYHQRKFKEEEEAISDNKQEKTRFYDTSSSIANFRKDLRDDDNKFIGMVISQMERKGMVEYTH